MKKPLFITDVDSTLLDMEGEFKNFLSMLYQRPVAGSIHWALDEGYGVPPEVISAMFDYVWDTPLKPYPDVKDWVALMKVDFTLVGISARGSTAARNAADRDFPQLGLDDYILVGDGKDKPGLMKKAVGMVDDNPRNLRYAYQEVPHVRRYLLDRPWNQSWDIDPFYKRVWFLNEVLAQERLNEL